VIEKPVPQLIIIAGPNGAGKTTFAKEYLSSFGARFEFVNADEISRTLALEIENHGSPDIRAAKAMLNRIDELVDASVDVAIETTLATLTYARKIPIWQGRGYHVSLIYLRLNSITESLERVRRRVEAGGHRIPPEIIERRFYKSLNYFETIYKPIVNSWHVRESQEGKFSPVDTSGPL
jgi:predicted ABC-type ATPase